MRSERACSLARHLMSLSQTAGQTASAQWFERTLDDSAVRRIVIPEAFLCADVLLTLLSNIADGLQVWPEVIRSHVMAELPFMATENILMACVKAGGDRQDLHEEIRAASMEAGKVVKQEGRPNDLLQRLKDNPKFAAVRDEMDSLVDPARFVGRAPEQVDDFLAECVDPMLARNAELLTVESVDTVNV